jgi:hypothetical protein
MRTARIFLKAAKSTAGPLWAGLFLLIFLPSTLWAQSPYLGGEADGYAGRFLQVTAVREVIAPDWARVYPSPVHIGEEVEVVILDVQSKASLRLYDARGRLVGQADASHAAGELHLRLDASKLRAGVYFLQAIRDEDLFNQKLIVW